jgi:hypothetical protein
MKKIVLLANWNTRKSAREWLMAGDWEFVESKGLFSSKFFVKPKDKNQKFVLEHCGFYVKELNGS